MTAAQQQPASPFPQPIRKKYEKRRYGWLRRDVFEKLEILEGHSLERDPRDDGYLNATVHGFWIVWKAAHGRTA
jgi:hypothetical protein